MLPAANRSSGQNLGSPDVCNTPTGSGVDAPIPYVNTADHSQAQGASNTTYVCMMNALNQGSTISQSNGDEAGTSHSTTRGTCAHTLGNLTIFIDSLPAINLSSLTSHNAGNCPSGTVTSAAASTVQFTLDRDGVPELGRGVRLSAEEIGEIEARMSERSVRVVSREGARVRVEVGVITDRAATELEAVLYGATELELDLRRSPGGSLLGAARVAGLFLPMGSTVAWVTDEDGDEEEVTAGREEPLRVALKVLVGAETASAAEVLADALARTGRVEIVGGTTRGKRSVQRMLVTEDGLAYATVGTFRAGERVPRAVSS